MQILKLLNLITKTSNVIKQYISIKKSKENDEVVCEHNFDNVIEYIGDTCWFNEIIKCTKCGELW